MEEMADGVVSGGACGGGKLEQREVGLQREVTRIVRSGMLRCLSTWQLVLRERVRMMRHSMLGHVVQVN
jgi:hypothetical protein